MSNTTKTAREMSLPFTSESSERREIARLLNEFSLPRAIRRKAARKPLQGVEAELSDLMSTRSNIGFKGNIYAPTAITRTGTAGNFQTTGEGSTFVPTAVGPVQLSSRQRPLLDALGVRRIQSGGSTIQLPKFTAGTVAIKAEGTDSDSSAATMATVTLTPQRASAHTFVTEQLLTQGGSDAVINAIVSELQADIARIIDRTAFDLLADSTNGITTNVEEATSTAGTPAVVTQRPLTQDMLDDMLRAAFDNGAEMRNMRYVASPKGFETVQGIQTNGVHALDKVADVINGRSFYASQSLVNHTDGTARVIVGDWEQGLIACDFGLLDVIVNPYSYDTAGKVLIGVHQYFDVQILDESVFSIYREEV